VKEQLAPHWQAALAVKDPQQRSLAMKALKREQAKLYAKASIGHLARAEAGINGALQEMRERQAEERKRLRASTPLINVVHSAKALMATAHAEHARREGLRSRLTAERQSNQLRAGTPQRRRSQAGNALDALTQAAGPQEQIRQGAQSGRVLSAEQKANAPKDVRQISAHRTDGSKARGEAQSKNHQHRGKDRGGGGRGR